MYICIQQIYFYYNQFTINQKIHISYMEQSLNITFEEMLL